MTVRLFDTRERATRDFSPAVAGHVTMYVCGPTVQSSPGVHHLRAAVAFDVMRRWLAYRFGRVTFIRNVTDIDDKVLERATDTDPWWAIAGRVEREFQAAYDAIGIAPPTYEPRATGSISQMIELIAELIERGHAYASGADVYFDVRSWPEYGSLTHQAIDDMVDQADAQPRGKRDPHDFALWKAAKADEPADAQWPSPWGQGRPGWHIECSAMARRYLGPSFDIHGGGLDLRFPHHENELAQSTAAGDPFARFWAHNGLVTVGGQKMSKSLGNYLPADDILTEHPASVVRYALAAPHYRSDFSITETTWSEARAALERIGSFLARADAALGPRANAAPGPRADAAPRAAAIGRADEFPELPQAFADALDDDLGVPQALAVVHEHVRRGNVALTAGDLDSVGRERAAVGAMLAVLGLRVDAADAPSGQTDALSSLVDALIAQRSAARAARDWAAADAARDALAQAGVVLEDGADGTTWKLDRKGDH